MSLGNSHVTGARFLSRSVTSDLKLRYGKKKKKEKHRKELKLHNNQHIKQENRTLM